MSFAGRYPSLRVAYIDEVEQRNDDRSKKLNGKVNYFSVLVRAVPKSSDSSEPVQNLDQVMLDLVSRSNGAIYLDFVLQFHIEGGQLFTYCNWV